VERLLAIWLPALATDDANGANLRLYAALLDELRALCPFVEPIRLGLFALPVRSPSRFFGGESAVLDAVRSVCEHETGLSPWLGIADGLFAAEAAARLHLVVPVGASRQFVRGLPLETLGRPDLATVGRRLGLHTVGAFADLPTARVAERFNRHALHVHAVAQGSEGEIRGQRDDHLLKRLRTLRGDEVVTSVQAGFFGEHRERDQRASAAARRVAQRLGPEGVMCAHVRGGRGPQDRVVLVPYGAPSPSSAASATAPWPGQLPAPTPTTTLRSPVAVTLLDDRECPVRVDAHGLLRSEPAMLVFSSGVRRSLGWFAGPWPQIERWWSTRRRRAYVQVVSDTDEAFLLYVEASAWWLAGVYD